MSPSMSPVMFSFLPGLLCFSSVWHCSLMLAIFSAFTRNRWPVLKCKMTLKISLGSTRTELLSSSLRFDSRCQANVLKQNSGDIIGVYECHRKMLNLCQLGTIRGDRCLQNRLAKLYIKTTRFRQPISPLVFFPSENVISPVTSMCTYFLLKQLFALFALFPPLLQLYALFFSVHFP
jgi:hypothetical protein